MSVVTFTEEFTSPDVPARRFYSAQVDSINLLPNLIPQVIKNIETIEGDGGPGSINKTTVAEGAKIKYLKHRIDALDKENMIYKYTLIEGDELLDNIEKISYEIKFEAAPDGGCKVTNINKYYLKPGAENEINEEELKAADEKALIILKAVESYLIANPVAYA